LVETLPAS